MPEKPSVVVLPFNNLSNDPEQEFLADGLAEDITTLLSNLRWLFVVARNSAFTYKGQAVNIIDVGRELGVRYVLEGSVRKAGSRIRVTAQLIDAEHGNHIWADRYDRVVEDIFEIQDDITRNIVGMLETEISSAEQVASLQRPANLDTWTAYQRGMSRLGNSYEAGEIALAIRDFKTATERDPNFAAALAGLSVAQIIYAVWGGVDADESKALRLTSLQSAKRAVRLDERDAWPLAALARAQMFNGAVDAARQAIERALALNRNSFQVLYAAAMVAASTGDAERALSLLDEVERISPRSPFRRVLSRVLRGQAHLCLGWKSQDRVHFEAALENFERTANETPGFWPRYYCLIASHCLNRKQETTRIAEEIRATWPDMTGETLEGLSWLHPDRAFFDWLLSVALAAGLPED